MAGVGFCNRQGNGPEHTMSPRSQRNSSTQSVYTLAHLSDIHLSPMPQVKARHLFSKRALGFVNWHRGRKFVHRREILDLLTKDLRARGPDHIAVTGDLVNLGLPEEFPRAADWLHDLGSPDEVTVIPGNHDAYVRLDPNKGIGHWRDYGVANTDGLALAPTPECGFPFVRRFGDIALIALSSAVPTAPFVAAGALGEQQRMALAAILEQLGREGLFRIVLIHHPPLPGQADWRRGLRDAQALKHILQNHGAELVLHGHNHEQSVAMLETNSGSAIVVGVPSASDGGEGDTVPARYNEYGIERAGNGWRIEMVGRKATHNGEVLECERRILKAK